jgi:hypothetical protein
MQLAHSLKAAWCQPLNLQSEKPVSKFAFKFNLYRYDERDLMHNHAEWLAKFRSEIEVGLDELNPVDP